MEGTRLTPGRRTSQGQTSQTEANHDIDSSQLPSFEYSQLPSDYIRLLSPDPESDSPGLAWRLRIVKLDEKPEFDALSYVWGSQAASHSILVNSRAYHVHPNLYSALPYLATRRGQKYPIWIDAICINQKDGNEIAAQVALMHQVYRGARMVWVWLGLGPSGVQTEILEAISLLAKINRAAQGISEATSNLARNGDDNMDLLVVKSNVWAAVSHLLSNDWYHRVWVMQEAALAKDLIFLCGEHETSATTIRAALHHIRAPNLVDEIGSRVLIPREMISATGLFHTRRIVQTHLRNRQQTSPNDNVLMRVSYHMVTKRTKCLLPEDRIWGMMGLSPSSTLDHTLRQAPDTANLYTRFSRHVLSRNDPAYRNIWWRWFRLPFCANLTSTLPSWVPDFHQAAARETSLDPIAHYLMNESVFNGTHNLYASRKATKLLLGEQIDEILLLGKRLDEVEEVLGGTRRDVLFANTIPFYTDITPFEALNHLRELADWMDMVDLHLDQWELMRTKGPARDEQPKHKDSWWRIMLTFWKEFNVDDFVRLRSGLHESREIAARYVDGHVNMLDKDSEYTKFHYHARLVLELSLFQRKRLFWTKSGRFGFTSRGVRPGDSVCVFDGAEIPHVLRKVDVLRDGRETWRFVGDAFVHGLMSGQADDIDVEGAEFCIV